VRGPIRTGASRSPEAPIHAGLYRKRLLRE
jgi:hypothetical protein